MDIGDVLKSLVNPERALEELAGDFGKTQAGQHILDIVKAVVAIGQQVEALGQGSSPAPQVTQDEAHQSAAGTHE